MKDTMAISGRVDRADEGNTLTDFDEEEIQRKITISTSLARRTSAMASSAVRFSDRARTLVVMMPPADWGG
jgi:translation elongation factor EF-G